MACLYQSQWLVEMALLSLCPQALIAKKSRTSIGIYVYIRLDFLIQYLLVVARISSFNAAGEVVHYTEGA